MITRSKANIRRKLQEQRWQAQWEDQVVTSDSDRDKDMVDYREGGEGWARWCEDNVNIMIYPYGSSTAVWVPIRELPDDPNPDTGKSYRSMWNQQKKVMRKALRMENGRFKNRLVIFCWMRGEGKSIDACLVQLWKFFCWTRQKIMLGATSRDQVKFVHYDIMRDFILNSPRLYQAVGKKNLQEKEIRLTNRYGELTSLVRTISTHTGILSNITGYTFSEMFAMKNKKLFTELDGSIRNIPNALGVIDSTVSAKDHILFQIFQNYKEGKTKTVYFSHRQSPMADPADYWNPNMDSTQLEDYKVKFTMGDFERFFCNTWDAGRERVFDDRMVEESLQLGVDGELLNHEKMHQLLDEVVEKDHQKNGILDKGFTEGVEILESEITGIMSRFRPVESLYQINNDHRGICVGASLYDIQEMSELFDTDWALLAGLDFADPMAIRKKARSIYTLILKGLPGSRTNPYVFDMEQSALKYIYFLIRLVNASNHTVNLLKEIIDEDHEQLDGIDTLCCERYGSWDMVNWCEDREIAFEPIAPTYGRQREAFKEYYTLVNEGRFKRVGVPIQGMNEEDLFEEEMKMLDHDPDRKWFGSPEKEEKYGVQDDTQFSVAWTLYGGRLLTPADLRARNLKKNFGVFLGGVQTVGKY